MRAAEAVLSFLPAVSDVRVADSSSERGKRGLRHPQREEVLPHAQLELRLLPFVPIAPCPVAGHNWKESGPVLLTPTLQIFMGIY